MRKNTNKNTDEKKKLAGFFMPCAVGATPKIARQSCGAWLIFLLIFNTTYATPPATLIASWYSIESLKKEGTYAKSRGIMANGDRFNDNLLTCATRLYPLGSLLLVTNLSNRKTVRVKVTDRIGKRFAQTRIDLSKRAFSEIADLKQGIVPISAEVLK